MTYEYRIKATPTEEKLKTQRPAIWEPCDLSSWNSGIFKCSEKTALHLFDKFVECNNKDNVYSLYQDKGWGFFEIKRS